MRFRKAVLLIHGLSGGLYDLEFLKNQLQKNRRFDCFAWTLPAHEKLVLNKVKYPEWIEAVDNQVQYLIDAGYKKIYVVGHSMGGLLSGYLAGKYKEIKKVVFVSAAYDYFSGNQYLKDLKNIGALKKDTDATYKNMLGKMFKVPITTIFELHKIIDALKPNIKKVVVPALILHGDMDEVVPYSTIDYVNINIGSKKKTKTTIKGGRHNLLRGSKKQEVIDYIELFLIGGRKWKQAKKQEL